METKGITQVLKTLGETFSKNSPTILTALSVGGLVSTVFLAVRATPKAIKIIDNYTGYDDNAEPVALTKREIVEYTWKLYIPAAAVGIVTIGCMIGANHISLRRNAALASLYGLTEAAFKEYQSKVVETIGRNKELKVRDDIAADHVKRNPPSSDIVISTGYGNVLCREDTVSGQYFRSNIEKVRSAINDVNQKGLTGMDMWVSLNDIYDEWRINQTKLGNVLGWDLNKENVSITHSSALSEDGEPCLVITFNTMPKAYGQ